MQSQLVNLEHNPEENEIVISSVMMPAPISSGSCGIIIQILLTLCPNPKQQQDDDILTLSATLFPHDINKKMISAQDAERYLLYSLLQ